MSSNKCAQCGLVNFAINETCRRCGAALGPGGPTQNGLAVETVQHRSLGRRLLWVVGMTLACLCVCFVSLILSSEGLSFNERQTVARVIPILERSGFSKEAFVLGTLATYRGTDNWWNLYVGHQEAYAATNFPFEVVTLYAEFFNFAVDDTERAVILLHESYHLFGSGEEAALEGVWREKQRLGWTADRYGQTKVWKNTREWTAAGVPRLFQCGADGRSDCMQ